ncbi:RHS repeat domain-containing protein [Paenibacillus sp. JSM ZJ436]
MDEDGNLLRGRLRGRSQDFVYDARDRLVQAGSSTYGYNAENERTWMNVKGQTTLYVVNPHAEYSQLLLETDEAGRVSAAYVYGLGLIGRENADGRYQSYHYDLRGSTTRLTDEEGDVTDRYTYGAFGELVKHEGTTRQPFAYNGRDGVQTDINGLYTMRARYYNPDIKRFMNRDVLRREVSLGLSMNRFAYVNGNPVTCVDPLGLDAIQAGMSKGTGKYQVGAYKDIRGVEGLDAHHAGQKAAMKKLVDNYDFNTAPAINVPKVGHTIKGPNGIVFRSTKGIDNLRQLLARDIRELRRVYDDIPNSALNKQKNVSRNEEVK